MPTYVYKCTSCDHEFEVKQRMSDDPISECPECQGSVRKLLFAPSISFKGSGFHVNDYSSCGAKTGGTSCPAGSCCDTGSCDAK